MTDKIVASVRTMVQNLVTVVVASLTAWLFQIGIEITIGPEVIESLSMALSVVLLAVGMGVWTYVQGLLETRFPSLVKWFSLGLAESGPTYSKTEPIA